MGSDAVVAALQVVVSSFPTRFPADECRKLALSQPSERLALAERLQGMARFPTALHSRVL